MSRLKKRSWASLQLVTAIIAIIVVFFIPMKKVDEIGVLYPVIFFLFLIVIWLVFVATLGFFEIDALKFAWAKKLWQIRRKKRSDRKKRVPIAKKRLEEKIF